MTDRVIEQLEAYGAHVDQVAPVLTLDEIEHRAAPAPPARVPTRWRVPGWAIAAAAALAMLVAVGGLSLVLGGSDGSVQPADTPPVTPVVVPSTTPPDVTQPSVEQVPLSAFETLPPEGDWNSILAETTARPTADMATCPSGSNPDLPGPADGARPLSRHISSLSGALDLRTGHVVYVDDADVVWLYDVCTNIWTRSNAQLDRRGDISHASLAYDADSGVTVMMGLGNVAVHEASLSKWDRRSSPSRDDVTMGLTGPFGAVYDPVSGLILTTFNYTDDPDVYPQQWSLWAYDVDTDTWTEIGDIGAHVGLLGYTAERDRLILTTSIDDDPVTLLIDPRTGERTLIPDESARYYNYVWPGYSYGQANDTVYAYQFDGPTGEGELQEYDTTTLSWTVREPPAAFPSTHVGFSAIVDDPINNRIILVNGIHSESRRVNATNDIWSIRPTTGQWLQLQYATD